ncbi:MAG: tetratricopeptide repeat protein [Alphaproteobacteria bacterium]
MMLGHCRRLLLRQPTMSALMLLVALTVALLLGRWLAIAQTPLTRQAVARHLLENGAPEKAAYVFEAPIWRGVAHYRAGRYQQAITAFIADGSIEGLYNLGNAYARLGLFQEAAGAYEAVLQRRPAHGDARFNLDLVRRAARREQEQLDETGGNENANDWQSNLEEAEGEDEGEERPGNNEQASASGDDQPSSSQEGASDDRQGGTGSDDTAGRSPQPAGRNANGRVIEGEQIDASVFSLADQGEEDQYDPPTDDLPPEESDVMGGEVDHDREESMADEIVLRRIKDDPAIVLRARLNMALRKQKALR